MPTSIELRQERARVVEAMRAITEAAEAENRNLSAEERESYDRGETEFRDYTERIARAETVERAEADGARDLTGATIPGGSAPADTGANPEQRAAARRAAFFSFVRRGVSGLGPEQRALVQNEAGEILVPEDLESEIIRVLPGLTIIRQLASTRPTTSNRIRRRSLSEVSVGWGKLETGQQTLTDSMPGVPEEEWTYIEDLYGLAKIGEDEFDDSDVALESFVTDSFGRAIGEAEDTAFTVGGGHPAKMPVGIFSPLGGVPVVTSAATTYAGTGANAPTALVDDCKGLVYAVKAQYRRNGAYLMSSATELAVSTVKDGNGRYLWEPNTQAGRPNTFLGYAIHNQEDISAPTAGQQIAAFGDFQAGYRVYPRAGMTIQRLTELYAEDGMVGFKVRYRVGGDVIRPDALRILATKA